MALQCGYSQVVKVLQCNDVVLPALQCSQVGIDMCTLQYEPRTTLMMGAVCD